MAQTVKRLSTMQETWVRSLGREDPLEKGMASTLVLLPGKSHGQRNLLTFVINTPSHPILVGISKQCRPTTTGGIPHSLFQCDFVWKALAMLSALKLLQNSGRDISAGPHSSTSALPYITLCMSAKSLQEYPTLCSPMDYSLASSSVHEILQARIPEWVSISFSKGSSPLRD